MNPEATEMVAAYLKEHSYDGLLNDMGDCGCDLTDLGPCFDGMQGNCQAAYKKVFSPGKCGDTEDDCPVDGTCDWHMVTEKPEALGA